MPALSPRFVVRLSQNLAAKREVQAAKVPDLIGIKKAGWNTSTLSENMSAKHTFPDRPMMRQLSAYDSHKRADYNYRAEQLDSTATAKYIPRPNKFQTNERALEVDKLQQPFHISRQEFPVHAALEGKPRWDPATGAGGDPYGVEKAQRKVLERDRVLALEYSRSHPPKNRSESLVQREDRFIAEQRAAKAAMRASATAPGGGMGASGAFGASQGGASWQAGNTLAGSGYGASGTMQPSLQVPVRKTTSWSLGGF